MQLVGRGGGRGFRIYVGDKLRTYGNKTNPLIQTRMQSSTGFSDFYNEDLEPGEPTFADVFHDVWRIFFTPSRPVREQIETEMKRMGLVPGEYAAAHLRAFRTHSHRHSFISFPPTHTVHTTTASYTAIYYYRYGYIGTRPERQVRQLTANA
eukprot:scaffold5817_cov101-Cylindrotheca_fusiformis.AAC.13